MDLVFCRVQKFYSIQTDSNLTKFSYKENGKFTGVEMQHMCPENSVSIKML